MRASMRANMVSLPSSPAAAVAVAAAPPPLQAATAAAAAAASRVVLCASSSTSPSPATSSKIISTGSRVMTDEASRAPMNLHRACSLVRRRSRQWRTSAHSPRVLAPASAPPAPPVGTEARSGAAASRRRVSISSASAAAALADLAVRFLNFCRAPLIPRSSASISARSVMWCGVAAPKESCAVLAAASAPASIVATAARCDSRLLPAALSTRASCAVYASTHSCAYAPPSSGVLNVSRMKRSLADTTAAWFSSTTAHSRAATSCTSRCTRFSSFAASRTRISRDLVPWMAPRPLSMAAMRATCAFSSPAAFAVALTKRSSAWRVDRAAPRRNRSKRRCCSMSWSARPRRFSSSRRPARGRCRRRFSSSSSVRSSTS
mmetsp:Transcript_1993/g.4624  ORF Transcript_1993/g.4624 Transcript_1993/m.4624 type:complete len:377 (+) Transcript_1993:1268-2398(+)